jgi:iron complex transport system permease protein
LNKLFFIIACVLTILIGVDLLFSNGAYLLEFDDYEVILYHFRLPKTISAIGSGAVLAVAGLIMQNIFKNPLAGPDVLGISQGAALAVAISVLLGAGIGGITLMSIIGALGYLFFLMWMSRYVVSSITLLLIGVMGGFLISAVISTLEVFSNAEELKSFVMWTMGSFAKSSLSQSLMWLFILPAVLLFSLLIGSKLDVLLLGDGQARLLGINNRKVMYSGILITALAIGASIALCGPIAFVGLVAPHLAKWVLKTYKHNRLILCSALIGAAITVLADILSSGLLGVMLPLNATLSILAAPVILFVVLKKVY